MPMQCPLPDADDTCVTLAHGGGGRLAWDLLEKVFLPALGDPNRHERHDGAVLDPAGAQVAFATDAHVVTPLFFPGGSIGHLAVCGTVNDLAMCGAEPRWLSTAFVLEEGLPMATLRRVLADMRTAADAAGVSIVTGDTKVVERGKADGLYVVTAGIGLVRAPAPVRPQAVKPGDAILLSGDLGRHGAAVLSIREGLEFEPAPLSDCQALHRPVLALLAAGVEVHCLRDCTRGGLTAALTEIARDGGVRLRIREAAIPVSPGVAAACELLGLDPLQLACEGRFIAFVPVAQVAAALAVLRADPVTAAAVPIGTVLALQAAGTVELETTLGVLRALELPAGEQLPRIC
ncbi:MAG: hydrogenase expression/formation protein HypE [Verrucomicrobia bacterium]|nr:hydrogenase expression/formation protein HypE [Verrucomicrobiota bacterium]